MNDVQPHDRSLGIALGQQEKGIAQACGVEFRPRMKWKLPEPHDEGPLMGWSFPGATYLLDGNDLRKRTFRTIRSGMSSGQRRLPKWIFDNGTATQGRIPIDLEVANEPFPIR
jgi:hypothetical protein